MKKLFIICAVFFLSISTSFGYNQETITAGPGPAGMTGAYNGITININANCQFVTITASWTQFNEDSTGAVGAWSSNGVLIGEHSPFWGTNYNNTIFNQYIENVTMNLHAYNCYGTATLSWNTY